MCASRRRPTFRARAFLSEYTFANCTFDASARFVEAILIGLPRSAFGGVRCAESLSFKGATIQRSRRFGPMAVGRLVLDEAILIDPLRVDAAVGAISTIRTQARGGLDLRLRYADVALEDIDLSVPSSVAWALPFDDLDESDVAALDRRIDVPGGSRPGLSRCAGPT